MHVLILGQGLAGSMMAWNLHQKGHSFTVVDDGAVDGASRVAAGLLSPLYGKYLSRSWQQEDALPSAFHAYRKIESFLGIHCCYAMPIHRLLTGDRAWQVYHKKASKPDFAQYIDGRPYRLHAKHGVAANAEGIDIVGGGFVDAARLIQAMRDWLREHGALIEDRIAPEEVTQQNGNIIWNGMAFDALVLAGGWQLRDWPGMARIPLKPVQGVLVEASIPKLHVDFILKEKHYLLPLGGHRYLLGATYKPNETNTQQTEAAASVLQQFAEWMAGSRVEVLSVRAGVRPATQDHLPLLGPIPGNPQVMVISGFGSRGILYAPYCAELLTDYLVHKKDLPESTSLNRFG